MIVYPLECPQLQVCINTTLAKVVLSKNNDVTDKFMILHCEEYLDLYKSALLKLWRLRCAGNFARVGQERSLGIILIV